MQRCEQGSAALLAALGITPSYCGYHAIVSAMALIEDRPERLSSLVKEVYMDVAKQQGRSWSNVERNIRYTSANAWRSDPQLIQQLIGHPLEKPPSNKEFLTMLYLHSK